MLFNVNFRYFPLPPSESYSESGSRDKLLIEFGSWKDALCGDLCNSRNKKPRVQRYW